MHTSTPAVDELNLPSVPASPDFVRDRRTRPTGQVLVRSVALSRYLSRASAAGRVQPHTSRPMRASERTRPSQLAFDGQVAYEVAVPARQATSRRGVQYLVDPAAGVGHDSPGHFGASLPDVF